MSAVFKSGIAIGVLAMALLSQSAHAQKTIKMTAFAGHPPVFPWVKLLDDYFIPEVDKRLAAAGGKVKIEWNRAYGGTLVKLGSESTALKDGLGEIGFVSTIFEAPKFPLQNITYYTPFGTDDISIVAKVITSLQNKIPEMKAAWTKNNAVFLGGTGLDAYHLFAKAPIAKLDDLKGLKINAPGPSANWLKDTGAIAVAGTLQTYYNDIQTGVTSGALTFATGGFPAKIYEVAPNITKVNYGAQFGGALAMNKKVLDRLPKDVQKIFLDVGQDYSEKFNALLTSTTNDLMRKMAAAGAHIREVPPAERKQWASAIPNPAIPWAKDLDAKGLPGTKVLKAYMAEMKANGVEYPRDWSQE